MLGGWPVALWDAPTQLCYSRNGDEITVKGYAGQGALLIGETLNGGTVRTIQRGPFTDCTSIAIPKTVSKIVGAPFVAAHLVEITVDPLNLNYCDADGILLNKDQTMLIQVPAANTLSYTIPATVTQIGDLAFTACSSLTSVLIPDGVTRIGNGAFHDCSALTTVTIPASVAQFGASSFGGCTSLRSVYFLGNAPCCMGDVAFYGTPTIYYLPGATGWALLWDDLPPSAAWLPTIATADGRFGAQANTFGFNVQWASGRTVVVESATDAKTWRPLATNTLSGGTFYFNDANWAKYPHQLYRLRAE